MFDITNDEKLRDAYALLMFMQKDVPASSKKKANVKNLAATVKREIRSYNNRPASNVRIISGDYNGHLDLVRLPDELDRILKLKPKLLTTPVITSQSILLPLKMEHK